MNFVYFKMNETKSPFYSMPNSYQNNQLTWVGTSTGGYANL